MTTSDDQQPQPSSVPSVRRFADRTAAGQELARLLLPFGDREPVVVALPRGGVPVAYEVARLLDAPLAVLVAKKLAAPRMPNRGVGAVAEGHETVLDLERMAIFGLLPRSFEDAARAAAEEVDIAARYYHRQHPLPDVRGRVVLLIDDGIATGVTARAALRVLRRRGPEMLVLAAPVGDARALAELTHEADEVVCTQSIGELESVRDGYDSFEPVSDPEALGLLDRAARDG